MRHRKRNERAAPRAIRGSESRGGASSAGKLSTAKKKRDRQKDRKVIVQFDGCWRDDPRSSISSRATPHSSLSSIPPHLRPHERSFRAKPHLVSRSPRTLASLRCCSPPVEAALHLFPVNSLFAPAYTRSNTIILKSVCRDQRGRVGIVIAPGAWT